VPTWTFWRPKRLKRVFRAFPNWKQMHPSSVGTYVLLTRRQSFVWRSIRLFVRIIDVKVETYCRLWPNDVPRSMVFSHSFWW
jgi:hypothetical protein